MARALRKPAPPSTSGATAPRGPRGRARRIVTVTDPNAAVLRRRSRAVPAVDAAIRRLVADMAVTMRRANGAGLAAVQIGVPLRVILADTGRGLLALVNPRLRARAGTDVGPEGCLSIPGVTARVRRALRVTVDGTLLTGQRVGLRASGFIARILQHEIDHLNGVLFLDRVRRSAVRRAAPRRRSRGDRWRGSTLAVSGGGRIRRRAARPRREGAAGRARPR
jgi:peptide deformylase